MDIADDIAYSTYDFEDAMKAGFTSVLDLLRLSRQPLLLRRIALKVWKRLNDRKDPFDENNIPDEIHPKIVEAETEVVAVLYELTGGIIPAEEAREAARAELKAVEGDVPSETADTLRRLNLVAQAYQAARDIQENGYLRSALTAQLVGEFIRGTDLRIDKDFVVFSEVVVDPAVRQKIEILKNYTYEVHIETARLKAIEFRGKEFVTEIFQCLLASPEMLPNDWRLRVMGIPTADHKRRCISDYVAGMTDRYALELYQRLKGGDPGTIFKEP